MNQLILILMLSWGCIANPFVKQMSKNIQMGPTKGPNDVWVMVIDTGIGPNLKLKDNVQYSQSDEYQDGHGHGTHVAGIVVYGNTSYSKDNKAYLGDQLCSNVKIFSCKYFDPKHPEWNTVAKETSCVKLATSLKMDYINFSGGGSEFSENEYKAYREFTESGGTVVTAAGNDHNDLTQHPYYPASYSFEDGFTLRQKREMTQDGKRKYVPLRIYSVMNSTLSGEVSYLSNYHPLAFKEVGINILSTLPNDSFGYMTGTSQAAPALLHLILKQRCYELGDQK